MEPGGEEGDQVGPLLDGERSRHEAGVEGPGGGRVLGDRRQEVVDDRLDRIEAGAVAEVFGTLDVSVAVNRTWSSEIPKVLAATCATFW